MLTKYSADCVSVQNNPPFPRDCIAGFKVYQDYPGLGLDCGYVQKNS